MLTLSIFSYIVGVIGGTCVVLAYWNTTIRKVWTHETIMFHITNLIGGILLFMSLMVDFNLGNLLIEIFWILISIKGIYACKLRKKLNNI